MKKDIHSILEAQGTKGAELVANELAKNPSRIPEIIHNLDSEKAKIRYGSSKALWLLSEKKPELLYSQFELFRKLMSGKNNIHKWTAIDILLNFSFVDDENKLDQKFYKNLIEMMRTDSMITAGHIICGIWKPAVNNQIPADQIADDLLSLRNKNISNECRNILAGDITGLFPKIYDLLNSKTKKKIELFIEKQANNSRPATRKKALQFKKQFVQNPTIKNQTL